MQKEALFMINRGWDNNYDENCLLTEHIWDISKHFSWKWFFKISKTRVKHIAKRNLIHDYHRVRVQLGGKLSLTEHIWDISWKSDTSI